MTAISIINRDEVDRVIKNDPLFVKKCLLEALKVHFHKKYFPLQKQRIVRSNDQQDKILAMPAGVNGNMNIYGIKWLGSRPDNVKKGLCRSSSIIIINNAETNAPKAIMSGELISAMRTFVMSLVAIDLFRPNPTTIGCVGLGRIGRLHLKFLMSLYPSVKKIFIYSKTAPMDDLLADPRVEQCASAEEVARKTKIIINTTNTQSPYLESAHIQKGSLLISLSSRDYHPDVFLDADLVVVDDTEACCTTKNKSSFKAAVNDSTFHQDRLFEISDLLYGHKGKIDTSGTVIVNPCGMAIEDVIVAERVYQRLCQDKQLSSIQI